MFKKCIIVGKAGGGLKHADNKAFKSRNKRLGYLAFIDIF